MCELFIKGITINQFSAGLCNDILINCTTTPPAEMDLFLFPIVLLCAAFNEFYRHFARNKFVLMAFILSSAAARLIASFCQGFVLIGVENTLQDKKLPRADGRIRLNP